MRPPDRVRLLDSERPVDELVIRGDQREVDAVTGELANRQRRLQTGDAAAGDHDTEPPRVVHDASMTSARWRDITRSG